MTTIMTLRRGAGTRTSAALAAAAATAGLLAALVAAPAGATSPTTPTSSPTTRPNGVPLTTSAVRAALAPMIAGSVPGAAALVDRGTLPVRAAAGSARLDPWVPATPGVQTRVGSITKSFVATVALQLVGEGKLQLDTPIGGLVPGVPNADRITLRMLMNHTSGLFNYTNDDDFVRVLLTDPNRRWAPAELLAVSASREVDFAPGEGWNYSNTNFVVVGMILEKVTRTPLQRLIKDRIATPLGLTNTYLATTSAFTGPHLYGALPAGALGPDPVDTTSWTPTWAWAAGALVSTTADLQTFYRALLRGQLLHGRQLQAMTTTIPLAPDFAYGLGLYTADFGCGPVWGHDGGMPGYVTVAGTTRDGRRAAMLLTNGDTSLTEEQGLPISYGYQSLSCLAAGKPVPPVVTPTDTGTPTPSGTPSATPSGTPSATPSGTPSASAARETAPPRAVVPEAVLASIVHPAARLDLLPSPLGLLR